MTLQQYRDELACVWELRDMLSKECKSLHNTYARSFDGWAGELSKSQIRMFFMLHLHRVRLSAVKAYRYLLINWFNGSRIGNPPNFNQVVRTFERTFL